MVKAHWADKSWYFHEIRNLFLIRLDRKFLFYVDLTTPKENKLVFSVGVVGSIRVVQPPKEGVMFETDRDSSKNDLVRRAPFELAEWKRILEDPNTTFADKSLARDEILKLQALLEQDARVKLDQNLPTHETGPLLF